MQAGLAAVRPKRPGHARVPFPVDVPTEDGVHNEEVQLEVLEHRGKCEQVGSELSAVARLQLYQDPQREVLGRKCQRGEVNCENIGLKRRASRASEWASGPTEQHKEKGRCRRASTVIFRRRSSAYPVSKLSPAEGR